MAGRNLRVDEIVSQHEAARILFNEIRRSESWFKTIVKSGEIESHTFDHLSTRIRFFALKDLQRIIEKYRKVPA